jgi:hypothetical protein
MGDVTVFKVEALTEGGYVAYAGRDYSQYCETLELAAKRLVVEVEQWAKDVANEIKEQAKEELTKPRIVALKT